MERGSLDQCYAVLCCAVQNNAVLCCDVQSSAVNTVQCNVVQLFVLEDTARYAGLLLAPAEGFGLRPRLFLPFGQKKCLLCCFGPFLAFFGVQ